MSFHSLFQLLKSCSFPSPVDLPWIHLRASLVVWQAKANAREARQWIDEWRAEQKSTSSAASNGSTPTAGSSAPTAKDNGSQATVSAEDGKAENVKEARQWIEDWRERCVSKRPDKSSSHRGHLRIH